MLSEINQTQKEGLSDPTHRRSLKESDFLLETSFFFVFLS